MRPHNITVDLASDGCCSHPSSPQESSTPCLSTPTVPSFMISPDGKMVKCVGDYMLGNKLGRGSFCKVRSATHLPTGCKYAIKIFKPRGRHSAWSDIEREIKVLSGLNHPNVVGLRDVLYIDAAGAVVVGNPSTSFGSAKKIYLVVDLAENGELFELIVKRGRLTEEDARFYFRQIISAVEYLHAHCIAHRDLKPENILLDKNNNIKINDFGLSNFLSPEHKMKTFCGSPIYAAPEVMKQYSYDGSKSDVWSLGVIIYTMVTGCLPWKLNLRTNIIENVDDMLAGKFDIPRSASAECGSILKKTLIVNPSHRAKLSEVRKHAWVNYGYVDFPSRFLEPNPPVDEIDKVILKQMEGMGYMQARVKQDIWANKIKPSVTIYHTLFQRKYPLLEAGSVEMPTQSHKRPKSSRSPKSPKSQKLMPKIPTSPVANKNSKSAPSTPTWQPMPTVSEDTNDETASPPPPPSPGMWTKDLGGVRNSTENRFAQYLKRRFSMPETDQERISALGAGSGASNGASNGASKKDKVGILERFIAWRKTGSNIVLPQSS